MNEDKKLKRRQQYSKKKWEKTMFSNPDFWVQHFKQMIDLHGGGFDVIMRVTRKNEVEIVLRSSIGIGN